MTISTPFYKDMDPYDMPKELRGLAAQNMGKIGAMQDLLHGVEKILGKKDADSKETVKETVVIQQQGGGPNVTALLKRAFLYLEDGDWKSAGEYCEKVLDQDPENPRAYLGKLLAGRRKKRLQELGAENTPFDEDLNYQKAIRFGEKRPEYVGELQTLRQLGDRIRTSQRLHQAMTDGDGDMLRECLNADFDPNYVGRVQNADVPLLISAIIKKDPGMVRLLLDKGADPNCERVFQDGRRFSALRDSIVEWPDNEIARMLIDAGADVDYIETNIKTSGKFSVPLLINAIFKKNPGVVRLLLDKGADPNCERVFQDGRRFSALRDSIVQWPDDEIVRMLIDVGADVDYIETNITTSGKLSVPLLINAIFKKNPGVVRLLLDKGADPNCERVFQDGRRFGALRDSILEWPNEEIALMLIDAGARFDKDEQIRKAKLDKARFSKEAFRRFREAGWRPPLF